MANINESIEKLTASLQELTARAHSHADQGETVAGSVSVDDLQVSVEVESFVAATRAYTEKTRNVSVGTY